MQAIAYEKSQDDWLIGYLTTLYRLHYEFLRQYSRLDNTESIPTMATEEWAIM
jgi:hypothetical protein